MNRPPFLATVVLASFFAGTHGEAAERLRLATTTSTENSGLLAELIPPFEGDSGIEIDVIAVGSGKAIRLAANGDADVILSHAPVLEQAFIEAGTGINRREVMYNDFVLVGPPRDPAGVRGFSSVAEALRRIASAGAAFVSRGDESGTHQKEKALWHLAGVEPSGAWYLPAGQGMGAVLLMADEREAYTLADRGTWIAYRRKGDLAILVEGDPPLFNPYTITAVNPARHPHVRYRAAMALIGWVTSREGQRLIDHFRIEGERLFRPLAVPAEAAP